MLHFKATCTTTRDASLRRTRKTPTHAAPSSDQNRAISQPLLEIEFAYVSTQSGNDANEMCKRTPDFEYSRVQIQSLK